MIFMILMFVILRLTITRYLKFFETKRNSYYGLCLLSIFVSKFEYFKNFVFRPIERMAALSFVCVPGLK